MARVLVTRAAEDAVHLSHALAQMGHRPVRVPLLERIWDLDALSSITDQPFDWLVVTSGASADILAAAAPGAWLRAKIGAVGPTTARKLMAMGRPPDLVPRRHLGAHLVQAMGNLEGKRVLYPKGDLAPPSTAEALRASGAEVVEVVCYRNVGPRGHREQLAAALPVDVTPLLSGSAVRRLHAAWPHEPSAFGRVIAIGPSTEQVAKELGIPVHAVARPHTLEAMLQLL